MFSDLLGRLKSLLQRCRQVGSALACGELLLDLRKSDSRLIGQFSRLVTSYSRLLQLTSEIIQLCLQALRISFPLRQLFRGPLMR